MNSIIILTASLLLPLSVLHAAEEPNTADDFVSLFNGKDFTGWRFSDKSAMPKQSPTAWNIENGVIIGSGDKRAILASQWEYEAFELEFDWRATNDDYDADFYVHAGRLLDAAPIRMKKGLDGGPQEDDRGEGGYNASPNGLIGGLGKARKAVPHLQNLTGQWNSWRVVVQKNIVTLSCNGKQAWSCNDYVPRRGYLGFRVLNGSLELRNIRIREIGYHSLMEDFKSWEVYPGFGGKGSIDTHWVRNGLLWTFKGAGPSIVTKRKDFANYRLRMEFMFADPDPSNINTGIYLRGMHPWQADIWEHKWGCGLWGVRHGQPDLGKAVRPLVRMDNPTGHWNYLDVRIENNVVSVCLNGRTTIDRYPIQEVDPKFPNSGGIGLQAHWPWKEVRFHNLRVMEMK
jgi:hypothetical protein